MKKTYEVKITEIYEKVIKVMAESPDDACEFAEELSYTGMEPMDENCLANKKFEVVGGSHEERSNG